MTYFEIILDFGIIRMTDLPYSNFSDLSLINIAKTTQPLTESRPSGSRILFALTHLANKFSVCFVSAIRKKLVYKHIQLQVFALCATLAVRVSSQEKDKDEDLPYEFGFTIDGQQHRHEKKGQ